MSKFEFDLTFVLDKLHRILFRWFNTKFNYKVYSKVLFKDRLLYQCMKRGGFLAKVHIETDDFLAED